MKIGIITHHYVNNYGAFLQAYALREKLAKQYPNDTVELINYINIKQFVINTCGWFRFYKDRENFTCWKSKIKVPITFFKERKKHLKLSKKCYTIKGINKLKYDVVIIGSDEVWNYQDRKSADKVKFGCGIECKNIIAYAPTVGNSIGNVPRYVFEGLKKFKAISVRDNATFELVKGVTGTEPITVLDPTFFGDFKGETVNNIKRPYILFYYCDRLPPKIRNQIFEYAKENSLAVYGAGECDKRYDDITVNLTPFSWVEMFRNAEFVFTGTFHGAVFSILNRKQFMAYLTNKSRIQKVTALLDKLKIKNREIKENFIFSLEDMNNLIDYTEVDALLAEYKRKSEDYLFEEIEKCRKNI